MTVYHLAKLVKELCKSSSPIEFVRWDHPDVELRVPSVRKARELLQVGTALRPSKKGLGATIAWYRQKLGITG